MRFVTGYHAGIDWIVHESGQNDKFVHVQVGLIVWLLSAALTGRRLGTLAPLALVGLAEIGNEIMDRLAVGRWNWPDTMGDAVATWAWPVVLTLVLAIDRRRRDGVAKRPVTTRPAAPFWSARAPLEPVTSETP